MTEILSSGGLLPRVFLGSLANVYGAVAPYEIGSLPHFLASFGDRHSRYSPWAILRLAEAAKLPSYDTLLSFSREHGERPVVLLRGYGGSESGPLLLSDGHTASQVGDEALMIFRSLGVPVVVSRRRVNGAIFIENQKLGSIIILDDGFQHRWLARDLDLVCIDCSSAKSVAKFCSGEILPLGILREPLKPALARASCFILNPRSQKLSSDLREKIEQVLPKGKAVFCSAISDLRVESCLHHKALAPQPIVAVCGIGNPESFLSTLQQAGFAVAESILLRDHQTLTIETIQTASRKGFPVVITEKDHARISFAHTAEIFVAKIGIAFEDLSEFSNCIFEAITKCRSDSKRE